MSQNQTELNRRLREAAEGGHLKRCQNLLRHGADVRSVDVRGRTALHEAASHGHVNVCSWLIENGADIESKTFQNGSTPLHLAASQGHVDVCRNLVAHGADIRAFRALKTLAIKHTALQIAVMLGKIDAVRYFIEECGEDIDQITENGKSLVELAATYNEKKMMAFLPVYLNSLRTERAVSDELPANEGSFLPSRSRGPSPL